MPRPKGSKLSDEHKNRIALALKGNKNGGYFKNPIERARKISQARIKRMNELGYLNSIETRKKMSLAKKGKTPWNKGKRFSDKARKKMSESQKKRFANPRKHPRWLNGKSFEPYSTLFTKQLKLKIRTRDNFICQLCGVNEKDYFQKLSINHIDYDKKNSLEDNLITLCRGCNSKVNANRNYWTAFFQEKVQRLETKLPKKEDGIV